MTAQYEIRAEVVDSNYDEPRPDDILLVDTNVWYWMTYGRTTQGKQPEKYSRPEYPRYLKKALTAHSRLLWSGLSLAELAHTIEQDEHQIYCEKSGNQINIKEFRHNLGEERGYVLAEIEDAWGQVIKMGSPLDTPVNAETTQAALNLIETRPLDGYDLFLLLAAQKANIQQILTDDGDFATAPDIQLFTANRNVIDLAREQGKLLGRRRIS